MAKKAAKSKAKKKAKKAKKAGGKTTPKLHFFDKGDVPDNISRLLDAKKLVPARFRGTDKLLDIVSWNIRWFDHQDDRRVTAIAEVLSAINADVFVLVEIAQDGALDDVVKLLADKDAGYYSVEYGTTGQQQRVALLWDRDWVRAKRPPSELFPDGATVIGLDGRQHEVFPRRPLWSYFEAKSSKPGKEGFTFELVGVHLKSQMPDKGVKGRGGIRQRSEAARRLVDWLETPSAHFDEDVIIIGDWNAVPDEKEWKPLQELEDEGKIDFQSINPKDDFTHIARLNKSGPGGSRLDLHLVTRTSQAQKAIGKDKGLVIRWELYDHLDALSAQERSILYKAMRENFSDHAPVATRFYFTAG